jgi:broad specificity phosphatase PhoE
VPQRHPEVVLVRHGETEWSASGRHTGRTDIPLTDRGRAQAGALGAALAGRRFARVLTSPLSRAAETCRLAGLGGMVDEDLREWDYGDHEGRTTPQIRQEDPGWTVWRGPVPGGEGLGEVAARADRVIERIVAAGGDVAVFSHGHFLRVLGARWIGLPPTSGGSFRLDTGTLSVLGWERETPAFVRWNVP